MSTSADGTLQPGSDCRSMALGLREKKKALVNRLSQSQVTAALELLISTGQIISTRVAVEHHRTESLT